MSLQTLRQDWLSNVRNDLLAGLVVALALIPEAIAFSIIAGVDPKVGLYASFSIATIIAFTGGRPGMISAATGAMALLMVSLVKDHGLEYLLAATVLTGVLQVIAGWVRLGALMRFVSRSVVTGFVNALAILIFLAQLPELTNVTWHVYAMTAAGLGIIYGLPYITRAVPSPTAARSSSHAKPCSSSEIPISGCGMSQIRVFGASTNWPENRKFPATNCRPRANRPIDRGSGCDWNPRAGKARRARHIAQRLPMLPFGGVLPVPCAISCLIRSAPPNPGSLFC